MVSVQVQAIAQRTWSNDLIDAVHPSPEPRRAVGRAGARNRPGATSSRLQVPLGEAGSESDDELHEEPLRRTHSRGGNLRLRGSTGVPARSRPTARRSRRASCGVSRRRSMLSDSRPRAWKEHLAAMDHLRQGIGHLRGYAQKNPKQEYKREAFEMFQASHPPAQDRSRSACSPRCSCATEEPGRGDSRPGNRRDRTRLEAVHAAPPESR